MTRLFAFVALFGFLLSLFVHIAALAGVDVAAKAPYVWSLHFGVFLVYIPFIFARRKAIGWRPTVAQICDLFPRWVITLGTIIFIYVIVNFVLFILASKGGSPSIHDGKFVLQDHGRLIREITASEYASFRANEVRGFSGHWIFFYFVPFAYFMFAKTSTPYIKPTV